jgi:hypothetical protein
MKKNDATKASSPRLISRKGWVLIVLTILLVVILGAFLTKDIPMRIRYSATINELEKIKKDVMGPAGAIQRAGEEKRGNGLLDTIFNCGIDVACPTVGAGWYVPIEPGKEAEFATSILQRQEYQITIENYHYCTSLSEGRSCGVSGNKDNFDIGVNIQATGPQAPTPPTTDVSPKIWRDVSIRITR